MTMKSGAVEAAQLAMFESARFGQGPAFWRWLETTEAEPYIAAFIEQQKKLEPGERFDLIGGFDDEPADILDRTDLSQLAAEIEAKYGEADATG